MNGGIGQFARVLDATLAGQSSPAPAVIDTDSDGGAWQRELIHSPNLTCGCCGVPAHACTVYAGVNRAQEPASATGGCGCGDATHGCTVEPCWPASELYDEGNLS